MQESRRFFAKNAKKAIFVMKIAFLLHSYVFSKGGRRISSRIFRSSPVPEVKTIGNRFYKEVTETRRNEANL